MNISWVIADSAILDPTVKIERLKSIGPLWGSWQTFRGFSTDNVVCYDNERAQDLVIKGFNLMCNFYVNQSAYPETPPQRVNLFGGTFEHDVNNRDEIVCIHLCNAGSDVGLLYGFDWSETSLTELGQHYRGLVFEILKQSEIQWVLVDHAKTLDSEFAKLENLTQDSLSNVLKLAS